MRSKSIFGGDADSFQPERWLEAGEEKRKRMEGVVDLCFGWGKYSCLGRRVAEIESSKVLVEVCEPFIFDPLLAGATDLKVV